MEKYNYASFCTHYGMSTKAEEWFQAALASPDAYMHEEIVEEIRKMGT